jgi:NAD(P)-dependent dehydrogenase (short-subunit alcohol dehydrogenase family)
MGRLAGKRAIVTGAGSGIGRASALLFAREGASVLAVERDRAALSDTVAAIRSAGGRGIEITGDAGQEPDVAAYIDRARSEFGGLDIIYANAGISGAWCLSSSNPSSNGARSCR